VKLLAEDLACFGANSANELLNGADHNGRKGTSDNQRLDSRTKRESDKRTSDYDNPIV
jgi:hypothetical protein